MVDYPEIDLDTTMIIGVPGQRVISPWPLVGPDSFGEPAATQAGRLLTHLSALVRDNQLAVTNVFTALERSTVPLVLGGTAEYNVEPFARWTALNELAAICRRHAERAGWSRTMYGDTALPGDWLRGLIVHAPHAVADLLQAAAELATAPG